MTAAIVTGSVLGLIFGLEQGWSQPLKHNPWRLVGELVSELPISALLAATIPLLAYMLLMLLGTELRWLADQYMPWLVRREPLFLQGPNNPQYLPFFRLPLTWLCLSVTTVMACRIAQFGAESARLVLVGRTHDSGFYRADKFPYHCPND